MSACARSAPATRSRLGSTQVNVLAPFRDYQPGPEPTNNDSLVLRVAYGATSVMLEGDAEAPIEQAMLAEPGLASTLLKVGHHGSITSTRPEFLARVAPQWAVISCGLHNRYGHPRAGGAGRARRRPRPHLPHRHQRRHLLPPRRQNRRPGTRLRLAASAVVHAQSIVFMQENAASASALRIPIRCLYQVGDGLGCGPVNGEQQGSFTG